MDVHVRLLHPGYFIGVCLSLPENVIVTSSIQRTAPIVVLYLDGKSCRRRDVNLHAGCVLLRVCGGDAS